MADYYWSEFGSYVMYPFKKVTWHISDREKHFNTAVFTIIALMMSEIPLIGGLRTDEMSEVTFKVSGTLMQLGTQPFVFASMAAPFLFDKPKDPKDTNDTRQHYPNLLGLVMSCAMAFKWGWSNGWLGALQLCLVAYLLLQSELYLQRRSLISPSTALIFAQASKRILISIFLQPVSFIWTALLVCGVAWVESLHVTVPLSHMKTRGHVRSMPLAVMYNSTSALIMYYTALETITSWYGPARFLTSQRWSKSILMAAPCLWLGVWKINTHLAGFNNQNARDLVKKWREQTNQINTG